MKADLLFWMFVSFLLGAGLTTMVYVWSSRNHKQGDK